MRCSNSTSDTTDTVDEDLTVTSPVQRLLKWGAHNGASVVDFAAMLPKARDRFTSLQHSTRGANPSAGNRQPRPSEDDSAILSFEHSNVHEAGVIATQVCAVQLAARRMCLLRKQLHARATFLLTKARSLACVRSCAHESHQRFTKVQSSVWHLQPIVAGQQLVAVPLRLTLVDYPGDPDATAHGLADAPPHVRLAAKLLQEVQLGPASHWAPYLQV